MILQLQFLSHEILHERNLILLEISFYNLLKKKNKKKKRKIGGRRPEEIEMKRRRKANKVQVVD